MVITIDVIADVNRLHIYLHLYNNSDNMILKISIYYFILIIFYNLL